MYAVLKVYCKFLTDGYIFIEIYKISRINEMQELFLRLLVKVLFMIYFQQLVLNFYICIL